MNDKIQSVVERRNVSMEPMQWRIVRQVNKERHLLSDSAALRQIIMEWVQLTGRIIKQEVNK